MASRAHGDTAQHPILRTVNPSASGRSHYADAVTEIPGQVRSGISQLAPFKGFDWEWANPIDGNYDSAATLSAVVITVKYATASSPTHGLLFHKGELKGQASPDAAHSFRSVMTTALTTRSPFESRFRANRMPVHRSRSTTSTSSGETVLSIGPEIGPSHKFPCRDGKKPRRSECLSITPQANTELAPASMSSALLRRVTRGSILPVHGCVA